MNKELNRELNKYFEKIISTVLNKKELKAVDKSFAEHELKTFLKQDSKARKYLNSDKVNPRSSEYKRIVKEIRAKLRRAHSLFDVGCDGEKLTMFKKSLKEAKTLEEVKKLSQQILLIHASRKERLDDYCSLYTWIFEKTGRIKSIIDLGCGLHPLSITLFDWKNSSIENYLAFDINNLEKELLNSFFDTLNHIDNNIRSRAKLINQIEEKTEKKIA